MDAYSRRLIDQYISAIGMRNVDVHSIKFIKGFEDWSRERKNISNNYVALLDYMQVNYDTPTCAEVGKGYIDSVVIPYQTTLLTPYTKMLNNIDKQRVIISNLRVYEGTPKILLKRKDGSFCIKNFPPGMIGTFMTENPYLSECIENWDQLHNKGSNDIVVGIFGTLNELDVNMKMRQLKLLKEKLNGEYKEEFCNIGDSYYYVLASDRKIKDDKVKVYYK